MARNAFLLSVGCLLASARVEAASPKVRERAARKACLVGDPAKGVAILSDLFLDTKDPNYIYNQGRCLEQNRRYEDAIARFQEYLRLGVKASATEKAEAEKHIADCQALLARQSGQAVPSPGSGLVAAGTGLPPPPPYPQTVVPGPAQPMQRPVSPERSLVATGAVQQPIQASASGSGLRTVGIVAASAGVVGLAAGVILNLKANSMATDMETTPGGYSAGKESDRKSYETLAWTSYGVGAACFAAGAVLYFVGMRVRSHGAAPVALLPTLAPGQAGAMLKGAF